MEKIAKFIVEKRKIILILTILMLAFSVLSSGWVKVEDELEAYLPADSDTRIGLDIMNEEFVTFGTADIMAENITYDDALLLSEKIAGLPGVDSVGFDRTSDHYNNASALFSVPFSYPEEDEECLDALEEAKQALYPYDIYVSTSLGNQEKDIIQQEVNVILVLVAVIVVTVLIFTSQTYAEVAVISLTFIAAMLLNKGTDFLLGKISFVSNSVTSILQLALSLDYAVILCGRFKEEHKTLPVEEACVKALSKAIPEIGASCLTTIGGLTAMLFMRFRIGSDMAVCLIKAILFAILSVFIIMPGLLVLFGNLIDKTAHKKFIPDVHFIGKFDYRTRHVVPVIFVVLAAAGFIFSGKCPYVYGYGSIVTPKTNFMQEAQNKISQNFTKSQLVALILPETDHEKEKKLFSELSTYDEVESIVGLANTEAMGGYTLTDCLTPRQFAELTDLDYEAARLLFALYAAQDTEGDPVALTIGNGGIPLMDLIRFAASVADTGLVELDGELRSELKDAAEKIENARKQLEGEQYSRALLYLDLPSGVDSSYDFLDRTESLAEDYYGGQKVYLAGNLTTEHEFKKSFAVDNITVSVISIAIVFIVLLFTFRSAVMPVLLVMIIQGSIWLNFAVPFLTDTPIFFMSYLIVSAIQMGANIDYAIVIASRYMETKSRMSVKEALADTMNFAFPTVITSGAILAASGGFIGNMTSEATIAGIGQCICRGTIMSVILVLFVLPQILAAGSRIIEKTSFDIKKIKLYGVIAAFVISSAVCTGMFSFESYAEELSLHISTTEDLLSLAEKARLDTWSDEVTVYLDSDISLEGEEFNGIPSFGGTFRGQGHSVTGLNISDEASERGFFGEIRESGLVSDLTVEGDISLSGNSHAAGGIAGINRGTISSCTFEGSCKAREMTGGIAGFNSASGLIEGCRTDGSASGLSMTGGIAGKNSGTITGCTNLLYVNIEETDPSLDLGSLSFTTAVDILSLFGSETINIARDSGGIAGYSDGKVISCINAAAVGYRHTGYNVGGIAGRNTGYISVCQNSGHIYGRKDIGGIAGHAQPFISELSSPSFEEEPEKKLESLRDAANAMQADADSLAGSIGGRIDGILNELSDSERILNELGDIAADALGEKTDEANGISDDVETVISGFSDARAELEKASDKINDGRRNLLRAREELSMVNSSGGEGIAASIRSALKHIRKASEYSKNAAADFKDAAEYLDSSAGTLGGIVSYMDRKGTVHFDDASPEAGIKADEFSESLRRVIDSAGLLKDELVNAEGIISRDIRDIEDSSYDAADAIAEAGEDAAEYAGKPLIEDVSGEEESSLDEASYGNGSGEETRGLIEGSINYGEVSGDVNTGGIAGVMGTESDADPEADPDSDGSLLMRRYQMRAVISGCSNYAAVTAKKDCAASICGRESLGTVTGCKAFGSAESTDGSYAGGIAGLSRGVISNCFSKCRLSAEKYAGGITGRGSDEEPGVTGSTVRDCVSLVEIAENSKYSGAISGTKEGSFTGNIFVSDILSGLGRDSVTGCAEPVTYKELISSRNLPPEFRQFSLRFYDGEKLLSEKKFSYGESFGEDVFPQLPHKEGKTGSWDRNDLTGLCFDTDVNAVYEDYITALGSEQKRNDGRRVFLAEGQFDSEQAVSAELLESADGEKWSVHVPHDGNSTRFLRFLPAAGEGGEVVISYTDGSGTVPVSYEKYGSYLRFEVPGDDVTIIAARKPDEKSNALFITVVSLVAAAGLALSVSGVIKRRKKKKTAGHALSVKEKKKTKFLTLLKWLMYTVISAAAVFMAWLYAYRKPVLRAGVDSLSVIMDYARNDAFDTDISAALSVGDKKYSFDLETAFSVYEGKNVYSIIHRGVQIYIADGIMYLPGGTAIGAEALKPDKWDLAGKIVDIVRKGGISASIEDGCTIYTINSDKEQALADTILSDFLGIDAETESLGIKLTVSGNGLKQIDISFTGRDADTGERIRLDAEAAVNEASRTIRVPKAVSEKMAEGKSAVFGTDTEGAFGLMRALIRLAGADEISADGSLQASCGPLSASRKDRIKLSAHENGGQQNSFDRAGSDITARVFEIACRSEITETEPGIFVIKPDSASVEELVHAALPKSQGMKISMDDGTVTISAQDGSLRSIGIKASGNVVIVNTKEPVKLDFSLSNIEL